MTIMHDDDYEFERLDRLIGANPPPSGTQDFPELVMRNLTGRSQILPIWQYPLVQWLATGTGLLFALGRLLGYIFSAWLSIQLAG
jgi:hypothetical protein